MTTTAIIEELEKLPLNDRLIVINQTIKSIRREEKERINKAVDLLYDDYKNDKELTIFTQLDSEPFYETK